MIKDIYENIKTLLKERPAFRDNDNKLVSFFWKAEVLEAKKDFRSDFSSFDVFCILFDDGQLSSFESITRARRKVQELNPELRGTKWAERHGAEEVVKAELKEIEKEESFHERFGEKKQQKKLDGLF